MTNNFFIKCFRYCIFTISLILFACLTKVYPQHYSEVQYSNGNYYRIVRPDSGFSAAAIENGTVISSNQENPGESVRIIVVLKEQPLMLYKSKQPRLQKISRSSAYTALQASHASFRTILNNISLHSNSNFSYRVKRDFYKSLNGMALECKRGMINRIRALPMVKYVSVDQRVKANLEESVHQIRADIVQDSLGITGKGVLIGHIDTGIDYNNPVLGGGFGPAFRVIGGYDFANNDSDPMDDNGHGTHVAGIIGANGSRDSLRGVAPGVKFLAVKVLDANGSGWDSDLIAGLEYCLDPDGNPETDDGVDVINLSLGRAQSSENPVDDAVNNTTAAGVLCVIAAGNSGHGKYGTIESPGTSQTALTVGACDSVYNIAYFSSLGPDPIHFNIKPEVVAPGVNILSTILNNQTASWSGTSMATPHVTGVAALLKQEHPDWPPGEIKAAIINSAHAAAGDASTFAQGGGCVDALDAAKTKMLVEPGTLSFGMVDLAQAEWKDTVNLTVMNFRSVVQRAKIVVLNGLPEGATFSIDKTSFNILPGQETTLQIILTVPASVPILSNSPAAYLGSIEVIADSDKVTVPFSFIKSTYFFVNFDMQPLMITLIDRTKLNYNNLTNILEGTTKVSFPITQGDSLEILALIKQNYTDVPNYYIVHKNFYNAVGLSYGYINHTDATVSLLDTIYDIQNNQIISDAFSNMDVNLYLSPGNNVFTENNALLGWALSFGILNNQVYISPLDSSFYIEKDITAIRGNDVFLLKKSSHGFQNNHDMYFDSGMDNLFGYHLSSSYDAPYPEGPPLSQKKVIIGLKSLTLTPHPNLWVYKTLNSASYASNIRNIYYNKTYVNQGWQNDKYSYPSLWVGTGYWPAENGMLTTPEFTINGNGDAVFALNHVTLWPPALAGKSPVYNYQTLNLGDTIKIEQNSHAEFPDHIAYIYNGSLYLTFNNDWYESSSYGGVKQFSGAIDSRNYGTTYWMYPLFNVQTFLRNRAQINMKPFSLDYHRYQYDNNILDAMYKFDYMNYNACTLRILSDTQPYKILGQAGQCTADFELQVPANSNVKTYVPSFSLLQVAVNSRAADVVRPGQGGKIRVILFNPDSNVTSVNLSLLLPSGDQIKLPVTYSGGNEYNAIIPDSTPAGYVDIIANVQDNKGNNCELTASPGFYFGSTTDNIHFDALVRLSSYSLDNVDKVTMQSGDTLNYTLSYINFGNSTAKNVVIKFPTVTYFKPLGSASITIDSINASDTIRIPVRLIFLGKKMSDDKWSYYSPEITWTATGGTIYHRDNKILIDFNNTFTGITQKNGLIPAKFELYQNYPNPFNPTTIIKYDLPKQSIVKLVVYDILGRKITTLVDEVKKAGSYQAVWNASQYASGVYFYRLEAGGNTASKKLLLLK